MNLSSSKLFGLSLNDRTIIILDGKRSGLKCKFIRYNGANVQLQTYDTKETVLLSTNRLIEVII